MLLGYAILLMNFGCNETLLIEQNPLKRDLLKPNELTLSKDQEITLPTAIPMLMLRTSTKIADSPKKKRETVEYRINSEGNLWKY